MVCVCVCAPPPSCRSPPRVYLFPVSSLSPSFFQIRPPSPPLSLPVWLCTLPPHPPASPRLLSPTPPSHDEPSPTALRPFSLAASVLPALCLPLWSLLSINPQRSVCLLQIRHNASDRRRNASPAAATTKTEGGVDWGVCVKGGGGLGTGKKRREENEDGVDEGGGNSACQASG